MTKKSSGNFELVVKDILNNPEFNKLKNELHHGITRYDHSLRVAKYTYKMCKLFKIKKIEEVTRAALLHDFYIDEQFNNETPKERLTIHPKLAAENSNKHFGITKLQENIIKSHMFPLKGEIPKHKESWLVTLADKSVATYEMPRFKLSGALSVYALFIINFIMQK